MKAIYLVPKVTILKLSVREGFLHTISNTTVGEGKGGWVKEDNFSNTSSTSSSSSYNVWDDDWND